MNGCSLFRRKMRFQNKANVHYKLGVEFNWMLEKWSVKVESCRDDNYGKGPAVNKWRYKRIPQIQKVQPFWLTRNSDWEDHWFPELVLIVTFELKAQY